MLPESAKDKPYSEACERNKTPILAVLREVFKDMTRVLEIGSGTGQHAVFFAAELPHLVWQPSDRAENLSGIQRWLDEVALPNIKPPLTLDVTMDDWPVDDNGVDGVFSANTAHIMGWSEVECFIAGVGRVLAPGGHFCLYGPFRYQGRHTSDSNARFDTSLRLHDPRMGVRDFEAVDALARQAGLKPLADHPLPANNRLLVWQKPASAT